MDRSVAGGWLLRAPPEPQPCMNATNPPSAKIRHKIDRERRIDDCMELEISTSRTGEGDLF
jgi:hypothetical protein